MLSFQKLQNTNTNTSLAFLLVLNINIFALFLILSIITSCSIATKKDTFGNVGAIAAAKAQARASKRKLAHPPYASFEDSMASSGELFFTFSMYMFCG